MVKFLARYLPLLLLTVNCLAQQELPDGLVDISDQISLDVRYATTANFTGEVLYPCQKCVLKKVAADALLEVNTYFEEQGFQLRIFDCYRPLDIQRLMWKVYPDPNYVANPDKIGSVHNRGYAVDLTLETLDGQALDMGTDYDHFGPEAHWDYAGLSESQQRNRGILLEGMKRFGFNPIRTEWWHFSYKKNSGDALNTPLPCKLD
ncbi:M15 family metallopeptidase [Aureitalea marina]|uniref:D-alanyl-D-alanine dipeptidase n=1 Tax=Aureitalea marina TaxID=930804 RepID=A0A2S7KPC9_9FLAO|nr:M15 family metallopeptidase [Aureitalea marina]PQB04423.1 hypothetical protein BST85_05555 [Aureitalea marina]